MRAIRTAGIGGTATLLLWILARSGSGTVADVAFLLAIVSCLATLGFTVAAAVDAVDARRDARPERHRPGRCTVCGKRLVEIASIQMCTACDHAPVTAGAPRRRRG